VAISTETAIVVNDLEALATEGSPFHALRSKRGTGNIWQFACLKIMNNVIVQQAIVNTETA
jgi:hypothetical protein